MTRPLVTATQRYNVDSRQRLRVILLLLFIALLLWIPSGLVLPASYVGNIAPLDC